MKCDTIHEVADISCAKVGGLEVYHRPGTTDEKVIEEVIKRKAYTLRGRFYVEKEDRWLDLGANIGTFSLFSAKSGAAVKAYEPEPNNFSLLMMNLRANGLDVDCRHSAVSAYDFDSVNLYICSGEYNKYRHTTKKTRGRKPIKVDCSKFSEIIEGFDCVKMDIEGSELPILDEFDDWSRFRKLVFEYHFDHDRLISRFEKRMDKLRDNFIHVNYAKMPDAVTYDYFPAARVVHCWS